MADKNELVDLEHDVERHEDDLDKLDKKLNKLRKEFDAVKDSFSTFRTEAQKSMNLLMWYSEKIRALVLASQKMYSAEEFKKLDKEAREQLDTLKKRLSL